MWGRWVRPPCWLLHRGQLERFSIHHGRLRYPIECPWRPEFVPILIHSLVLERDDGWYCGVVSTGEMKGGTYSGLHSSSTCIKAAPAGAEVSGLVIEPARPPENAAVPAPAAPTEPTTPAQWAPG
ncbi:unnamed protein product [Discosporangium mesarthrocarpum]